MQLVGKNFDDIDSKTIQALVAASAPESIYLEFKSQSYGREDRDKKEFLKDITAFANCLGGHLILGVEEKEGSASAVKPLSGDVGKEVERLENIAGTGVEPKIIGLRPKRVQMETGEIIVIHIPRSYNPPHRVIFNKSNRYYSRNSFGVQELSMEELRRLFGQQRTMEERAEAFVNERFLRIQANDGALPLEKKYGYMVMHLVPMPDFDHGRRHDIGVLRKQNIKPIIPDTVNPHINFNLYGLVSFYTYKKENLDNYTQIFRDGCIESTEDVFNDKNGERCLRGPFPKYIIDALSSYMSTLQALNASPPILLQISFLRMKDVVFAIESFEQVIPGNLSLPPSAHEDLHLPSSVIPHYSEDGKYESVIAEQMHILWNAFGLEKCPHFDEKGKWIGKRH